MMRIPWMENGNLVDDPDQAEAAAQPAAPTVDMSIEKLRISIIF